MPITLTGDSGQIVVETEPLARGGEGGIHRILHPAGERARTEVVKLYKDSGVAARRREKVEYFIQNPPAGTKYVHHQTGTIEPLLAWPSEAVRDDRGQFVGFVMPLVADAIQLQELCSTSNPVDRRHGVQWKRFMHGEASAPQLRMQIAQNIAAAVSEVHKKGLYTLIDLKPANVLLKPNGLVTLVDVDSAQVLDHGVLRFRCPVSTPEYTPPEGQPQIAKVNPAAGAPASREWDLFSYAVIVYELLLGIHPFTGPCVEPRSGAQLTLPAEKIAYGYFANGARKHAFSGIAPPHLAFVSLPSSLQDLFVRCFDAGFSNPAARPSVDEWYAAFHDLKRHRQTSFKGANVPHATPVATIRQKKPSARRRRGPGAATVQTPAAVPIGAQQFAAPTSPTPPFTVGVPPSTGGQPRLAPRDLRTLAAWSGFGVFVVIVLASSGGDRRQQTISPSAPPFYAPNPKPSPVQPAGSPAEKPAIPDESQQKTPQNVGEAVSQANCGLLTVCLYSEPSVDAPMRAIDTASAILDWHSTEFGYEILLTDSTRGFIRASELSRFTHLPSKKAVNVAVP